MSNQVKLIDVPVKYRAEAMHCLKRFEEYEHCNLVGFTYGIIGSFSIYKTRAGNTIIRFYKEVG